jgi:hypothetical protein
MTRRSQRKTPRLSDPAQHLTHEARAMLLARSTKCSDPRNAERNWKGATNYWERHAINAVLDLEEVENELKAAYKALEVARSYIDGHALEGQRFSPRKTLEVVNAALAKRGESHCDLPLGRSNKKSVGMNQRA